MSNDNRDPGVDDAFKQLDGALCIWARAKGETPLREYFHEVTPNSKRMLLGDKVFLVTIAEAKDDEQK